MKRLALFFLLLISININANAALTCGSFCDPDDTPTNGCMIDNVCEAFCTSYYSFNASTSIADWHDPQNFDCLIYTCKTGMGFISGANNVCGCTTAGKYWAGTACTACPRGSYRTATDAVNITQCALCTAGTSTSATGSTKNTECAAANCTNRVNVATWATPTWNNANPTTCQIASCQPGYSISSNTCVANTYTISFSNNGGTGTQNSITCTYNSSCTIPTLSPTITRTSYIFTKWNTLSTGTGTNYMPGSSFTYNTTGNLTLYAIWGTCAPGNYWNGSICKQCPIGSWANGRTASGAASACTLCTAGTTAPAGSSTGCTACSTITGLRTWVTPTFNGTNYDSVLNICKLETCINGYYKLSTQDSCTTCPPGSTSNHSSTLKTQCKITGGTTGTKFCDKHGCFNLATGIEGFYVGP